jgi:uncharacterized protein (DUF736 family)
METKQNSGAIFKNDYKKQGDKQPEYKGKIIVDGKDKEIALWLAESKDGKKYFSVKISEPYVKDSGEQAGFEAINDDNLGF